MCKTDLPIPIKYDFEITSSIDKIEKVKQAIIDELEDIIDTYISSVHYYTHSLINSAASPMLAWFSITVYTNIIDAVIVDSTITSCVNKFRREDNGITDFTVDFNPSVSLMYKD